MKVAYLIEYRKTTNGHKQTTKRWLPIGVVASPPTLTPIAVLDRVRDEHPSLESYELRIRFFHPIPGARVDGSVSNVMVIDSAVAPIAV